MRGSFINGSFVADEAPPLPETEEEKAKREKKELMESFKLMSKEDSKAEMKTKNFEEFMGKASRIVERALDQEFDVVGDFFEESDDEGATGKKQKGDKITQQFIFQPNMHIKRAVTSMDWSPKVSQVLWVLDLIFVLHRKPSSSLSATASAVSSDMMSQTAWSTSSRSA